MRQFELKGFVDEELTKEFMSEIPAHITTTFHRAFDVCVDWRHCYHQIEQLGFNKILTSGQCRTALEGRRLISQLVELSKSNNIGIIAGAGINSANLLTILNDTQCREFHASCRVPRASQMIHRNTQVSMGSPLINEFEVMAANRDVCLELATIFKPWQLTI